jgi:putative lipoprotein
MIPLRTAALAVLIGAGTLAGRALAADDTTIAKITGTVTYTERIALPPDALVRVRLEDTSRAERPPKLVAAVTVGTGGKQVPIAFELIYTATDIQASRRYVVRAAILVDGKTIFASKARYPVITHGAPTKLEILVQQSPPGRASRTPLAGTSWRLFELEGAPVAAGSGASSANLAFDADPKTFHGSTGCNQISGAYDLANGGLRLTPGPMTMMACADDMMKQERAFVEALQAVTGVRIADGKLDLLAGDRVLARFDSRGVQSE